MTAHKTYAGGHFIAYFTGTIRPTVTVNGPFKVIE